MNTRMLGMVAGSMACLLMAACSTPTEITTQDGRTVTTPDRPDLDKEEGFVTYEKDGKEVQMNRSEVRTIEEVR